MKYLLFLFALVVAVSAANPLFAIDLDQHPELRALVDRMVERHE